MGNSLGGFKRVLGSGAQSTTHYQGGFIWDFVDQGLAHYDEIGKVSFYYGGDFNNHDATDNSFNNNGLIAPTARRSPTPTRHASSTSRSGLRPSTSRLARWRSITRTSSPTSKPYALEWELVQDGVCDQGRPHGQPRRRTAAAQADHAGLHFGRHLPRGQEVLLNVRYVLTEKQPLLDIGHVAAKNQMSIKDYDTAAAFAMKESARP